MLRRVFAFLPTLGFYEMFLLLVVGLLLYGRNLPQAGRTLGRFVAQLKRGFQDFKDQMDRDESIREVRKTIQDTTREMRSLTTLPRAIADPGSAVRDFARDALASPAPDATGTHDEHPTLDATDERADEEQPDEPPPPVANTLPLPAPTIAAPKTDS